MRALPVVSKGETSVVYAWQRHEVIKLYNKNVPLHSIHYEAKAAAAAHAAGVPTPRVTGVVSHEDRTGIVFEKIEGVSMGAALQEKPWLVTRGIAQRFADAHAAMHDCRVHGLREQQVFMTRLMHNAARTAYRKKLEELRTLDELTDSESDHLCHNDFHLGNVMIGEKGLFIIDWARATRGDPIVDMVTTLFKLGRSVRIPDRQPMRRWLVTRLGRWFGTAYQRHYLARRPLSPDKIRCLLPIIETAYRRDHVIDKKQLREEMRDAFRARGIDGLNEWASRAIESGYGNEEHINKLAYVFLRRKLPDHARRFGERALEINPEDHRLTISLDELRSDS